MSQLLLLGAGSARSGGASWDPSQLTNLELWLKPESLGDAATTVATWSDSSSNGRDFTQGVEASKPVVVSGLDGNKAAQFDGTDDYLTNAAISPSQPLNIVAVVRDTRVTTSYSSFLTDGITGERAVAILRVFSVSDKQVQMAAKTTVSTSPATRYETDGWALYRWYFDGASSAISKNGAALATAVSSPGTEGLSGMNLGTRNTATANFLDGEVSEVLVVGSMTAEEVTSLNAYFAAKYPSLGL